MIVVACITALVAFSQNSAKPVDPDAFGLVYYWDISAGLKPLPREPTKLTSRTKGLNGVVGVVEVGGARSIFRLTQGQSQIFVVKVVPGSDPAKYPLYRMEAGKNGREFIYFEKKGVINKNIESGHPFLAPTITKFAESSYQFGFDRELPPGEYLIDNPNPGDNMAFTFGVDPKP